MILTGDIPSLNAEKYPNRAAVLREDIESRTWAELDANVNRLARVLLGLGVSKGDRVILLARNRTECVEAFFACARIGAIYAPINYRFTSHEVAYVLEDSGAHVMLCDTEYGELVREILASDTPHQINSVIGFGDGHGFDLDYNTLLAAESPERPETPEINEDDVCWVCYTGGTTGMSKGVMLTHRNNFIQCIQLGIADRIEHDDTYLVTGALFHVVLNMGLAYWFLGCTVVIMDFEPNKCLDLVERHGVTVTVPVATMLNMLLEEQRRNPRDISTLRLCGTGGAPINPDVVRRASREWDTEFVQYFGQTEAAHHFTYLSARDYERGFAEDATEAERLRLKSGGRAQHCNRVRILDDFDNVLPIGHVGEICASGPNIMAGYWNKPELTEETLRGGWLHTGDMGYMDNDGYIYVVDRKKDMIVSGGENVYSSEVEAALYTSENVLECAVIGVPDNQWGEAVTAFVVKSDEAASKSEDELSTELIEHMRTRLAAYKVPKQVHFRDQLPKSATGKIQKLELRKEFWGDRTQMVGASGDMSHNGTTEQDASDKELTS